MSDDWRIRITVTDGDDNLLDRLGSELGDEARELARELKERRLAVSRDGDELFVYADTQAAATKAHDVIEAVLREGGVHATESKVEHWLDEEDRWDDEPPGETWEEEELEHGHAPWEVRVTLSSHPEARRLAEQLETEGYPVVRHWKYLIVGTASKEDAQALAERVHGEVEPGGELVWEVLPENPFAIFGGLGSSGAPG
ncbi:MAG TPA: SPOR domain-containing protein [Gaiellaceae bacterium]|jgi:hypothetical protein